MKEGEPNAEDYLVKGASSEYIFEESFLPLFTENPRLFTHVPHKFMRLFKKLSEDCKGDVYYDFLEELIFILKEHKHTVYNELVPIRHVMRERKPENLGEMGMKMQVDLLGAELENSDTAIELLRVERDKFMIKPQKEIFRPGQFKLKTSILILHYSGLLDGVSNVSKQGREIRRLLGKGSDDLRTILTYRTIMKGDRTYEQYGDKTCMLKPRLEEARDFFVEMGLKNMAEMVEEDLERLKKTKLK